MSIESYRDLTVWQKSIEMVVIIYEMTEEFPKGERYGLTSQMRRAAISIPSNIAEGRYRGGAKEFCYFLRIAFGSGAELETQIEISKRLPQTKRIDYSNVENLLQEVMKMLNVMISRLK